ncbi:hypothetical protein BBJ28_00005806 [Nothophytophthora sp. Chile5]|nr:hypothetical protein BBJ28_00005806 [Nothophytophthora sp. Chile5]
MEFSAPNETDVDMAMHDDAMLNPNLAAQYGGHHPQAARPLPVHGGMNSGPFPGVYVPGLNPMEQPQQGDAMEEYARLMGIKVEMEGDPSAGAFGVAPPQDLAKIQANAAYFENLISRERTDGVSDMEDGSNVTSMTLPAGIGGGLNGPFLGAPPMFNPTPELGFADGGSRLYDPTARFQMQQQAQYGGPENPQQRGLLPPQLVGSQTLPPEVISAMIKSNPPQNFESLSEDERQALLKEEKSRERNRDHSRKSRLRKKEFVESLKHEVGQLQVYQQICEQCLDCIALVAAESSAIFLYSSAAYTRVLGYQPHQIVPGQTSFLDLVHPDNAQEVRAVFTKFSTLGETRRFQFRIKSMEGEYFRAETSARLAEKGVVCSTRVDREI